jgi:hypothetical protein
MKLSKVAFLSLLIMLAPSVNYAQRATFDPSGNYNFANSRGIRQEYNPQNNPSGFKEFEFHLETSEWRNESVGNVPIKPRGTVEDENGRYKMTQISIRGLSFSFQTETVKGIGYQFSGRFLKGGDFAALNLDSTVVLAGKLIKTYNGKTVAETNRRYYWWIARH